METILEWLQPLLTGLQQLRDGIDIHLLNMLGAVLLIVAGWLLAKLFRYLVNRLSKVIDYILETLAKRYKVLITPPKHSIAKGIANVGYWVIILYFISIALQVLGWSRLIVFFKTYLPLALGAAVIILIGYAVANIVSRIITNNSEKKQHQYLSLLGKFSRFFIILFAALLALDYIGIDTTFPTTVALIILAGFFVGSAFAFGLGASTLVKNMLAYRTVCKNYQIGQLIQLERAQGTLLDIQPQFIVFETAEGKMIMPTYQFAEQPNTIRQSSKD